MQTSDQPTVLCVDDEPHVLSSLALYLRRRFRVLAATSGAQGLQLLRENPQTVAVMSDMRMPAMDGAQFLAQARELCPDAPRMLLTGNADVESAVAAVNDGQIFRFLLKPCPPPTVLACFEAALAQHRLVTAERVLLGQTLKGALGALSEALAMASPAAFGTATRIKQLAGELAQQLLPAHRWAVEVAAMVAPLGSIALPDDVAAKVERGAPLEGEEAAMAARVPTLTDAVLSNIPRLEIVRAMLALAEDRALPATLTFSHDEEVVIRSGGAILRVAIDFDRLETAGDAGGLSLATLRARGNRYDARVLAALEALRGGGSRREVREVAPDGLRAGMVIAADVRLATGVLLVARGFEVTAGLIERVRNLRPGAMAPVVRVFAG